MKRDVAFGLLGFSLLVIVVVGLNYDITGRVLEGGDSSKVSRSFEGNSVDENILVTLNVDFDSGFVHNVYVVEENVPAGFSIVDSGSAVRSGNVLRWAGVDVANGLDSRDLTYTVRTSNVGSYSFVGFYGMDGMDSDEEIAGDGELVVIKAAEEEEPAVVSYNRFWLKMRRFFSDWWRR